MILVKMALLMALNSSHAYDGDNNVPDGVDIEEGYDGNSPTFVPTEQAPIQNTAVNQAGARPATNAEFMPDSADADENGYVNHQDPVENSLDDGDME